MDNNSVTYFAETNYRNERRRFGIQRDDRRRHMYVIGKTGMGKSTLLENMIIQDIQNGEGLAVVDPHGDLVEKVLDYIPNERINDVVYFNPSDYHHPIAFNILEDVDPQYKHLVSNGLVGVFKKIWADSWGPRLEYILINTILALLEYPGSTLLGVMRMLVDGSYRKKVVKRIEDPVVKSFWVNEFNNYTEKFRNEAIAPIQNKVGQFLASSLIRNIVGQNSGSLDIREAMDSQKILLMNLSKGRIGEENSALLGAMMITKIQLAAMSRVDTPEEERKDFILYVDEFQNFATESFAGILSEARKYRLALVMAHQYIEQLNDEVRAAVFGNVGTMVTFRVGATDAEELEKEYSPTFTQEDIVTLPAYQIYLRLMINGVASDPFSASTLPPLSGKTENREKVINVSRERYANPLDKVEDAINRWSNPANPNDDSIQGAEDNDKKGDKSDNRKKDGKRDNKGKEKDNRSNDQKREDWKNSRNQKGKKGESDTAESKKESKNEKKKEAPEPVGEQAAQPEVPQVDHAAMPKPPAQPVQIDSASIPKPMSTPQQVVTHVGSSKNSINFVEQLNRKIAEQEELLNEQPQVQPAQEPVQPVEQKTVKEPQQPVETVDEPKPKKNKRSESKPQKKSQPERSQKQKKQEKKSQQKEKKAESQPAEKPKPAPSKKKKQPVVKPKANNISQAIGGLPTPVSVESKKEKAPATVAAQPEQKSVQEEVVQQAAISEKPLPKPLRDKQAKQKDETSQPKPPQQEAASEAITENGEVVKRKRKRRRRRKKKPKGAQPQQQNQSHQSDTTVSRNPNPAPQQTPQSQAAQPLQPGQRIQF